MSSRLAVRVPAFSIRWYASGEHCSDPSPGDWILVDHGTDVDRAVGIGEWLTAHLSDRALLPFVWCRHAGLVYSTSDPITGPIVSEMGPGGHERRALRSYRARLYAVVHFEMADVQREAVLAVDDACAGIGYGWLQYLPLTIDGLTGAAFSGSWGNTMICSTLVAFCSIAGGFVPDRAADRVIPAHLARYVDARPPTG